LLYFVIFIMLVRQFHIFSVKTVAYHLSAYPVSHVYKSRISYLMFSAYSMNHC